MPSPQTVTQARSRTAILAYLGAAVAGEFPDRARVVAWCQRHGLAIRDRGLRDALALRLTRRGHSPPATGDPGERDWIRESLDFDATKLDLDLAILVLPAADRDQHVIDVLRSTNRVVRLYEGYDRDLVALIVYDGAKERRQLQTLLEEHEPRLRWIVVREVDNTAAADTWLSLARKIAGQEGLLG